MEIIIEGYKLTDTLADPLLSYLNRIPIPCAVI